MDKPQVSQLVGSAVGLLADMVDMGLAVIALDEVPAELTDPAVSGDHGQPGAPPRG